MRTKLLNTSVIFGIFLVPVAVRLSLYGQDIQSYSQESESEKHSVRWTGQFSSTDDFEKGAGVINGVFDFLFGKENIGLVKPISVMAKHPGLFWVLDQGNRMLTMVDGSSADVELIKPDEDHAYPSLVGICAREGKEILFTDSRENKIFLLEEDSDSPQILNVSLNLNQPTGIAYSPVTKEIWVAETAAHSLSVLNKNGVLLRRIGKRGSRPGEFNFPTFIWIDGSGRIYVVDSMNFRVQILSKEGDVVAVFGEPGDATGYFARPKGIATDSHGNIYVVDALFHTVQIFDRHGNFLHNFGEQGRGEGDFWLPVGIYIDEQDRIYVADSYNARIQMFQLVHGDINED